MSGRRSRGSALAVFVVAAVVAPATAGEMERPVMEGFQEIVLSVSDLEGTAGFFEEAAGWEVLHRGRAGSDLARLWRLDEAQSIDEILLRNPGDERGFLRLVAFPGAEQVQIRSAARTWDPGGIFDFNVRVLDIHRKFEQFRAAGWQFYSEPILFRFGPFEVWEVLAKGPDGVVIAMVERVKPPLEGWPNLRELSHIFNATQVVGDFERSRAFYVETLGFEVYLQHDGPSEEAGPNVLGLPHNLAAEIPRRVVILSPDGSNSGSVELLGFEGLTGTDFSDRAVPPNLGLLALRFPVDGIEALRRRIASRGVLPVAGPASVRIEPYGWVDIMAVQAPEGAWLEFFEGPAPEKSKGAGEER